MVRLPRLLLTALLALTVTACASGLQDMRSGPGYRPGFGTDTRPVSLHEPINGSTRARLAYATRTPDACAVWLAQQGVVFTPVADRAESPACTVTGAGTLRDQPGQGDAQLFPARPMMTCPLAAAVAIWRRQSVEPAAREILGASVRQIDHMGVYACRSVNNQPGARPSAHARAAAIDIAGVRLTNGRRITVAKDWGGQGAEARFLRRIRSDACRLFGVTLSPDYNALHADHLHLEAVQGGTCG